MGSDRIYTPRYNQRTALGVEKREVFCNFRLCIENRAKLV